MLSELSIKNFAIIDELTLEFSPDFNVLTGETGAGKSIVLDAVSMLLGARADNSDIRTGAERASVEGIFMLDNGNLREQVNAILTREDLESDAPDMLILSREIKRGGRNICRINGSIVTLNIMQEISEGLIDIHGQSEHLTLLKQATHIELLDRFGGLMPQRLEFSKTVRNLYGVRREMKELIENKAALEQRAEMLAYQVQEIQDAKLKPDEDETLPEEAQRLGSAEQLASAVTEAYQALFASDDGPPTNDLITQAAAALSRLARIDSGAKNLAELAENMAIQAEEIGRELTRYEDTIEFDPMRLNEVEMRMNMIRQLKRKYHCETIPELITAGEKAAQEYESIENSGDRIEQLQAEEAQLLLEIGRAGAALSSARVEVANTLSQGVETELTDLRMENARFSVSIEQVDDLNGAVVGDYRVGFDESGIDRVEFLIAPNVGEPLKPIIRIASGGETARIMLALKTVLSRADETPTLVFDEIDAGIGGRIGAVVGEKLWSLAHNHQTFVVTHLPQLAGFADKHFKVEKHMTKDKRTVTRVMALQDEGQIDEITAMLGAEAESARQSAQDLLHYISQIKQQTAPSTN